MGGKKLNIQILQEQGKTLKLDVGRKRGRLKQDSRKKSGTVQKG